MFGTQDSLDALLHRSRPTWLQLFIVSPIKTLAKTLYSYRSWYYLPKPANSITVVCISDTHNRFPKVPNGDLLIHAGDLSQGGTQQEVQRTLDWLKDEPHQFKVVIAGNHELLLDDQKGFSNAERRSLNWYDLVYLQDSTKSLRFKNGRTLNIYGSPWTRKHGNWAFEYSRDIDKWTKTVPESTDVLITHMPPFGHLDLDGLGDEQLLREVRRVQPKLHVFGHIHAGYGNDELHNDSFEAIYEAVMRRQAGLWSILKMACCVVWARAVRRKVSSHCGTILVNAATVGGPRDTEIREPITVQI